MANNKIQVKRTSTSGRTANVTNSGNTQYIDAGELALNMADGILYTSNGSSLITVGANQVNQSVTGTLTVNAISLNGQLTITNGSNNILLTNATSNWIYWGAAGTGAPAFTTRSDGTKLVLYPTLDVSQADYALGINAGTLWSSIPGNDGGQFFKWYGGTTEVASLSGTGQMQITGTVNAASHTVGSAFTANSTVVNAVSYYAGSLLIANSTVSNATHLGGTIASGYQTTAGLSANVATLASNSATYANSSVTNTFTIGTGTYSVANGNVGIGNSSPASKLRVEGTISFPLGSIDSNYLLLQSNAAFSPQLIVSSTANDAFGAYWNSRKTRITGSVLNGDDLGTFVFQGHDGTQILNASYIAAEVSGTVSTGVIPTRIGFYTTNATGTLAERFSIENSSIQLKFPTTAQQNLTINGVISNGSLGTAGQLLTSNGTSTYWSTAAAATVNTAAQYIWTNTQTFANSLYINNNKGLNFQTTNTSAYASFVQQSDDNFVFYTTNASYGQRAVWSIFANNNTANLRFSTQTTFNGNVDFNIIALYANGSPGTAGQLLASNGSSTYWVSPGAASVNTAAQFGWTNTHTFSANVSFTGNGIGISTNTGAIYLGGISDANWKIGRNTNATTKWRYSNNTLDILAANSNLEGVVIGNPLASGTTYFETGHIGTYIASNVTIGNTSSNSTINSTAFSGTANNASYLGGQLPAYYTNATNLSTGTVPYARLGGNVVNTTSSFTFTNFQTIDSFGNQLLLHSGALDHPTVIHRNDNADYYLLLSANSTSANGTWNSLRPFFINLQTGLLTSQNGQVFSGITTFNSNVLFGSSGLSSNGSFGTSGQVLHSNGTATYWAADDQGVTSVATGNGMTGGTISTTGTVSVLANTGIVANATGVFVNSAYIATLTANNANNLGGVAAASYVQNTDSRTLSGNLTFTGAATEFQSAALGTTATNYVNNFVIYTNVGNGSYLRFYHYRHTTGSGWVEASTRIQQRIDATDMGYIEFNPSGFNQGLGLYGSSGKGLTINQTGQSTFGNTVILGSVGVSSNGSLGTAGQVLSSNGTATYWSTASGGAVATSDTAPGSPTDGTLWWNSTLGKMFIYYDDGTSSQWVESSPALAAPERSYDYAIAYALKSISF